MEKFYSIRKDVLKALDIAYHETMNEKYHDAKTIIKELFPVEKSKRFHNLLYFQNWKDAVPMLNQVIYNLKYVNRVQQGKHSDLEITMVDVPEWCYNTIPEEYRNKFSEIISYSTEDYLGSLIDLKKYYNMILNQRTIEEIKYDIKRAEECKLYNNKNKLEKIIANNIFRLIDEED